MSGIADINNDCPYTNGEYKWYVEHVQSFQTVVLVGAANDEPYVNHKSRFYLFEPMESSYTHLAKYYEHCPMIKVIQSALGDKVCELQFYEDTYSCVERKTHIQSKSNPIPIPCTTLTTYCKENSIKRIDFLKIDVEGMDAAVLRGLDLTQVQVHYIQFEYGGAWRDNAESIVGLLRYIQSYKLPYKLSLITPKGLMPIDSINGDDYQYRNLLIEFQ